MHQIIKIMKETTHRCRICNYLYNSMEGDHSSGIRPGTAFDELPEDWKCPVCSASKEEFELFD
jgi:rubredoxin